MVFKILQYQKLRMGKKKRTWFESHVSDKYVQMAQKDNYSSRAV